MGLGRNNGGKQFVEEENRFNIRYMIRYNNGSSLPRSRSSSTFYPMIAAKSKGEVDKNNKSSTVSIRKVYYVLMKQPPIKIKKGDPVGEQKHT